MSAAPTRIRYSVLAMMCSLAMITYLDRALNANAKGPVMEAVGRPAHDYNLLIVAFQIAYALFEIPTGWLGDVYGPRKTLLRVVLWWSGFIGLMGLAGLPILGSGFTLTFATLVVIQFLFGMGEAGAFPNISKALYQWFPATQRAFVQGAVWFSSRLMGGLTPFIWVLLVSVAGFSWRWAIALFAIVGVIWCMVFYVQFRNRPEEHPQVNDAEKELIGQGKSIKPAEHARVPWGRLFGQPNMWYLCGMYFCMNFGWYFLMFFLPEYMKKTFAIEGGSGAMSQLGVALLAGSPLLLGCFGCILGGYLSDWFIRRTGSQTWGRRSIGLMGYGLCVVCYGGAILGQGNPYLVTLCIALVGFFNDVTLGPAWATAQDVGRRYSAIVSGCMNMIGNLGGALSTYITSLVISHYQSAQQEGQGYVICLTMYGVAYGIGMVFWYLTDAGKPLVED